MLLNPSELKITTISEDKNKGVFSFEPLPTNFGHTIGNSLKRILLTSLKGAVITQVKIAGSDHQFTTIPGVKEDVVEITLNLKRIRFKVYGDNPVVLNINKKGPGEVTAADIELTSDMEVMNKNQHIASLADKNTNLKMELIVESGAGYSPMEERQSSKIGVIILDADFSPVKSVSYNVESARFGKDINLDNLILTVETDGSIKPSEAVKRSAELLKDFAAKMQEWISPAQEPEGENTITGNEKRVMTEKISVEELPLPTRTINALKKQGIETLDQLAEKSDEELADVKNLGEKSVEEIKKLLKKEGLL
ncbi:DNA-directed RNA polymerase subunit alpha [candidate division WWE3 bacterium RIFCSPHIGHO2_12_FULL_38_15]|uniref:DNA-directed RNA polymerase subunit alpha n=1 Tax=candidate division WWE3 bacterium RIFCSPHIGHO2_02_FULL_38_14 TaxID=1802620 RepID=A0A1F4VB43_UNCKA|nr:MAG: DNA-directed RNA polymerase subunit alpha [candidate division WWE3 bacterium RIFCSPHIGHO2_01_FULL_38_45]OGC49055.1 MAG: DNA-directed RNA polymerase subunit alpha [candidate division WWE3 bacterium RIFCSPHIGHO2_12_FULL_38_15]OGC53510.1 MAG: DNA-directed RNA polymerase subunit alpha [candidate division WWE3 bacterium RIFCSPLOWO2_01_FULL_37_24]OGC54414.1 MAG: DNA-directed RNA polymerase subunit alpha [candidate division WWE3 bacterium RIFCSPHIGHO2_02_FULL_38_14]HLB51659.1 DNA-directed RNA 